MSARTAIFVLGMHRSGTSALARMLSLLGASLPLHLYPPGIGNEAGHWEPEAAVRLHDQLLETAGTAANDLCGPVESWFETRTAHMFTEQMGELVSSEFGDRPLFVFKDPRTALVFPLWRRVLARAAIRCVAVIVSRNPVEAALSLADRQAKATPGQSWPLDRGGLLWLRYTLAAERYTRDTQRSFCLYPDLLDDWRRIARRLASDLDLSWPRPPSEAGRDIDSFLSAQLRRHRDSGQVGGRQGVWQRWIAPVFAALRDASVGYEPDRDLFDAVGRSFDNACISIRSESPAADSRERLAGPSFARPAQDRRTGRRRLCLAGAAFVLPREHEVRLRAIAESAAGAGFDLTIVSVGAPPHPADATLNDLAVAYGLDSQYCEPGSQAIEPAYMRSTIELFRHLRGQHFDAILFQDDEGLAYASLIAKKTGLAFAETVLGVLALGGSGWGRHRERRFPANPVTIAIEYIERRAVELADVVVLPSPRVTRWMLQAGWQLGMTLPLPEAAGETPSEDADWTAVLQQLQLADRRSVASGEELRSESVTVVITHFEQPKLLDQNLAALTQQTDPDFSVVVVDDGSRSEEASRYLDGIEAQYRALNLRLIRQDNRYLGAARNTGIRAANTEFVILLDDDNVAFPDMVRTLRRAISLASADVVTCGISKFRDATGEPRFGMDRNDPDQFFPGGPVLLGAIHNCFGDASGIYRKSVFERVGYFHELSGVTFEDWQMHLRIVTSGLGLLSLPEPLVWYRVRPDSMLRRTNRYDNARVIAGTIRQTPPTLLESLADYLMGSEEELVRLNGELDAIRAVAAVNSIIVLEARSEARRHAHDLQEIVEERTKSAGRAEQYARSLEAALAELQESLRTATAYAASLERSRAEMEEYAKSLEAELGKRTEET